MVCTLLNSMEKFHSHLYFNDDNFIKAQHLADLAKRTNFFDFITISEKPIGPHPLGMVEAHFSNLNYKAAIEWLKKNRGDFSVLIHRDSGDDFSDHTEGIVWFGTKLKLNFLFFDLIKKTPSLRIHTP